MITGAITVFLLSAGLGKLFGKIGAPFWPCVPIILVVTLIIFPIMNSMGLP
jgi:hypothetical protein